MDRKKYYKGLFEIGGKYFNMGCVIKNKTIYKEIKKHFKEQKLKYERERKFEINERMGKIGMDEHYIDSLKKVENEYKI